MTTVRLTVGHGDGALPGRAVQRARRHAAPAHRGVLRHLGHGNVAGLGQGLLEAELEAGLGPGEGLRYLQGRNEQAMVHAAVAFARTWNRMSALACTSWAF
jgi:3D-(3,5/4)-trihydroxycyclohexane-1,2-dione acylhydrolase (decyclizing)